MLKQPTPGTQALDLFETQLQGSLIRPGDAAYDTARRVWNGIIDRYPAAIARCASINDVVTSVNFAREHQLAGVSKIVVIRTASRERDNQDTAGDIVGAGSRRRQRV